MVKEPITKSTSISIGVLLAIIIPLIVSAGAYGALTMKVSNIEEDVIELKLQLVSLDEKLDTILINKDLSLR